METPAKPTALLDEAIRYTIEPPVSQGTQVPEPVKPLLNILFARHFSRDLNGVIRDISDEEVLGLIAAILVDQDTTSEFLAAVRLPEPQNGGFWMGTVLPLLRKRLQPKPQSPGPYARDIFKEAKQKVRIEDLAERFTTLYPAGAGKLKGICPLHEERTASFYVYTSQDSWYCYGACHRGGDVVELARVLMAEGLWRT